MTLICYVPFIVTDVNKLSTKTRLRRSSVLLTSKKEIDEGLSTSGKGIEPHFAYLTLSPFWTLRLLTCWQIAGSLWLEADTCTRGVAKPDENRKKDLIAICKCYKNTNLLILRIKTYVKALEVLPNSGKRSIEWTEQQSSSSRYIVSNYLHTYI